MSAIRIVTGSTVAKRGPARAVMMHPTMNVDAAALGEVTLEDASGAPVQVASIWAERPAILVFLRHFG